MLLRTSILLLALTGPASAESNAPTCTLSDQQVATAISTFREWPKIHAFYKANFPPCPDDGMFAEGYSELIVRTLATNWSGLNELRVAAGQDPKFKAFFLRHIDATTNDEADLRAILSSASSRCPKGSGALCAEIRQATSGATQRNQVNMRKWCRVPNPSLKRSANGRPLGPVWQYAVHFRQPGPGVLPSSPA